MKVAIVIGFILCLFSTTAWGKMIIIANPSSPVTELSRADAARIFLGKEVKWKNGKAIVLATLWTGASNKTFLSKVVKKTSYQFLTYWRKIVFTGKGKAPRKFASELSLAYFVSKTPGAVGYLDSKTPHPGTKDVVLK